MLLNAKEIKKFTRSKTKTGRFEMKRLTLLCSVMVLLTTAMANASVVDAPHNETHGYTCGSCHTYSLWWKYSPAASDTGYTGIVDAVCLKCHKAGGEGPNALAHTLGNMNASPDKYTPAWLGEGCMACHNPHYQSQLTYAPAEPDAYLVTGHIVSVQPDVPSPNTTTITYDLGGVGDKTNANWPAAGLAETDPDWANKSAITPGRGLIFVHDKGLKSNTFNILSATTTTVVVKGLLDPAKTLASSCVDTSTTPATAGTCDTFGLAYGQLIKPTIAGKPVRLFDPNGGFVGNGSTTTGICQVCHTRTSRYTVTDPSFPVGLDTHVGRENLNCASCHLHSVGFKGVGGHDDTSFKWGTANCNTCHNVGNTVTNIVEQVHGAKCELCHATTQGGGPRQAGPPANGVDGTAVGATNASACVDCHTVAAPVIHHDSASDYYVNGNCAVCHQTTPNHNISASVGGLACGDCHAAKVASAEANHQSCVTCHHSTNQTVIDVIAAKLPSTCASCHGPSKHEPTPAHGITATVGGLTCADCHAAKVASAEANHGLCVVCHQSTRQAVIDTIAAKAPSTCASCHGTSKHEPTPAHGITTTVGGLACANCHAAKVTNAEANHGLCVVCHQSTRAEVVSTIAAKVPSTCASCHGISKHDPTPAHGITATVGGLACADCHAGKVSNAEGNHATCETCHQSTDAAVMATIAAKAPSTCASCHGTDKHSTGHPAGITAPLGGLTCSDCHAAKVANAYVNHAACTTCHQSTNPLVVATIATKAASTCASCHGNNKHVPTPPHNITATVGGLACADCHAAKVANA